MLLIKEECSAIQTGECIQLQEVDGRYSERVTFICTKGCKKDVRNRRVRSLSKNVLKLLRTFATLHTSRAAGEKQ